MKEVSSFRTKNQKGQVTIFVILALIIVVAGVLIYLFYPNIQTTSNSVPENPKSYMQNALETPLQEQATTIGENGGSLISELNSGVNKTNYPYINYNGSKVEYLCYTNKYYEKCTVQRVLLVQHIEEGLKTTLKSNVDKSFSQMVSDYRSKGYDVQINKGDYDVSLLPNKIILHSNTSVVLTKGSESPIKYASFDIVIDNNLYELASIARVIVNWEKTYGDSDPIFFMSLYRNIKVEKKMLSDGTKIYTLTDRITNDKFQFASRSVVWPEGVSFS